MDYFAFDFLTNPNKRVYWLYLLSSLFLAIAYYYFFNKNTKVILSPKLWLHPSAKLDYYYFFFFYFINIFLLAPYILSAKSVAFYISKFLNEQFEYFDNDLFSYTQIGFLYTITLFLFFVFSRYWLYRFLHTIPFLWEFHKVHHSAKVLTPVTFYRVHPV